MSKRRTRKDKERAIHSFTFSWENKPEKASNEPSVKMQLKNVDNSKSESGTLIKKTLGTAKDDISGSIKHRIFKSLILVSLILGIEVVVYFIWNV